MRIADLLGSAGDHRERETLLALVSDCANLFPNDEVPEHLVAELRKRAQSLVRHRLEAARSLRLAPGPEQPLRRYILTGDILHPGRICVEARSLNEALRAAGDGKFVVYGEQGDCLAFNWNGEPDTVWTEDP